jgi:hypothetical protein
MAPDKKTIAKVFAHLADGDQDGFFANVVPNVGKCISSSI